MNHEDHTEHDPTPEPAPEPSHDKLHEVKTEIEKRLAAIPVPEDLPEGVLTAALEGKLSLTNEQKAIVGRVNSYHLKRILLQYSEDEILKMSDSPIHYVRQASGKNGGRPPSTAMIRRFELALGLPLHAFDKTGASPTTPRIQTKYSPPAFDMFSTPIIDSPRKAAKTIDADLFSAAVSIVNIESKDSGISHDKFAEITALVYNHAAEHGYKGCSALAKTMIRYLR